MLNTVNLNVNFLKKFTYACGTPHYLIFLQFWQIWFTFDHLRAEHIHIFIWVSWYLTYTYTITSIHITKKLWSCYSTNVMIQNVKHCCSMRNLMDSTTHISVHSNNLHANHSIQHTTMIINNWQLPSTFLNQYLLFAYGSKIW